MKNMKPEIQPDCCKRLTKALSNFNMPIDIPKFSRANLQEELKKETT